MVILEGSDTVGLALARSISHFGAPVVYFCSSKGLLGRSRMVSVAPAPSGGPWEDADAYDEALAGLGRDLSLSWDRKILVFPSNDASLHVLRRAWPRAQECFSCAGRAGALPPGGLLDKAELLRRLRKRLSPALQRGILPASHICRSARQAAGVVDEVGLPCILKPARSDPRLALCAKRGAKAAVARSQQDVRKLAARGVALFGEILVQEMVAQEPGKEVCAWGYRRRNGQVWGATARELRKWPRYGGTATYTVTEQNNEVAWRSKAILDALEYQGIYELAFMQDRNGHYKFLVELNGRPWLQVLNAAAAGVDVARIAYCDHYGLDLPVREAGVSGVEWTRIAQDVLAVASGGGALTPAVAMWLRCVFSKGGGEAVLSAADFACLCRLPLFAGERAVAWLKRRRLAFPAQSTLI